MRLPDARQRPFKRTGARNSAEPGRDDIAALALFGTSAVAPERPAALRQLPGDNASGVDADRISEWMRARLPDLPAAAQIELLPGIAPCQTCRIVVADRAYAMRRAPVVPSPSAQPLEREYRLLEALARAGFPVPRPIALCSDATVGGAPFYLSEMIDGHVYRGDSVARLAPQKRRQLCEALVDTIAQLHSIDPETAGLGHLCSSGNYLEEQIRCWTNEYRAAQTDAIDEMEGLIDWLSCTIPRPERPAIIHGDFGIGHILFAHDVSRPVAVTGWESATIGDPLADFAHFAGQWIMPCASGDGFADGDLKRPGVPSLSEIMARYGVRTGRRHVPDLHWHFAFSLFRLAVILQSRMHRMVESEALAAEHSATKSRVSAVAKLGWQQALRVCARRSA